MSNPTEPSPPLPADRLCDPIAAFLAAGCLQGSSSPCGRNSGQLRALGERAEASAAGAERGEDLGGPPPMGGVPGAPPAEPLPESHTKFILEHKTGSACASRTYEPLGEKLERYGKHHARALAMGNFLTNRNPNRAEKLRTCGAWLQFRDYYTADERRLTAGAFCQQHRLCPLCACRRAGRYLRAYVEKIHTVMTQRPELRPYLVTLTVKNGPDLGERVGHLLASLHELHERRRDSLKNARRGYNVSPSAAAAAIAGVSSIEIKRGSGSGLWHPHAHGVWLCVHPPEANVLACEWFSITGDSHVVDVRPLHCNELLGADLPADAWELLAGDLCEVFKYALKFADLPLEDNLHAFETLHRRRLIEAFGELRRVVVNEDLQDEPLGEDLPYIELIARYHARESAYRIARQFHVDMPIQSA